VGGQGVERREILRYIGIASVAAAFPGFHQWAFAGHEAADHAAGHAAEPATTSSYQPLFFSPAHYQLVEHLAEMIIPEDDTPGARKAGVAEFIDFMVANRAPVSPRGEIRSTTDAIRQGDDTQERFVEGLNWLNAHSHSEFGAEFLAATPVQQTSLLEQLAFRDKFRPTTEPGREFFQLMRDFTVVGYYTSRVGLKALGYPGLRTVWRQMPGCTHLDDPEHLHLKPPAAPQAAPGRS
jgi:hypothetical protein